MNELALFAGAGGGILGGHLLGWRCICAVEINPYARDVLVARQNDGCLAPFPVWDDIRTFDGKPWRGAVDVVSGGFPCQDISAAGKGAGIEGKRSGLWREMARVISEVRPRFAWVENSPLLVRRGLGLVLRDLAALGYDARWGIVGADDAGAPHKRKRIWIVAHTMRDGRDERGAEQPGQWRVSAPFGAGPHVADATRQRGGAGLCQVEQEQDRNQSSNGGGDVADADSTGLEERESKQGNNGEKQQTVIGADWWQSEPDVGRVANRVAARVDRLRCIGNGQVPAVVRLAWEMLTGSWGN